MMHSSKRLYNTSFVRFAYFNLVVLTKSFM